MEESTLRFYDELADDYHLISTDWRESVLRQASLLDNLIHAETRARDVLDCACGIGTQAIGLALRGYTVHATDLSPLAIKRAKREAASFGVSIKFGVADFRSLHADVAGEYDVVIACDNALPHLLGDEDLRLAAHNLRAKLCENGLLLASIRDYDHIIKSKPHSTLPRVFDDDQGRRIVFQVWDWSEDGRSYEVHQLIVRQDIEEWQTSHHKTIYRALLRGELSAILNEVGFLDTAWHIPDESGYYQPVVTARKR